MDSNTATPMPHIHSFAPVADSRARILILGSMPGKASLAAGQYYAHPQNLFWRIMGEVTGARKERPYPERLCALRNAGIALWDVLESCTRESSLDSDIDRTTIVPNAFGPFFAAHPGIRLILFNGATAETLFRRHVLPDLAPRTFDYRRLPSTSPAHTSLSYAAKLAEWRWALEKEEGCPSAGLYYVSMKT